MAKVSNLERLVLDGGLWRPGERPGRPDESDIVELRRAPPSLMERMETWQNGVIDVDEIDTGIRGLPTALEGMRIAVVSDIHLSRRLFRGEAILNAAAKAHPDLICMLGDLVDTGTKSAEPYYPFLRGLSAIAPCAAVMGNNDYACGHMPVLRDAYAKAGIPLLEDETRAIPRGNAFIRLVGLQDYNAFAYHIPVIRSMGMPGVAPVTASADPHTIDILMLHRPQRAARMSRFGFDIAMAGHAHGGQWRLPWGQGIFAPGQGLFPQYTSGLYNVDGMSLIVGRGLGNHEFPIRLGNRPHMPVIILRSK